MYAQAVLLVYVAIDNALMLIVNDGDLSVFRTLTNINSFTDVHVFKNSFAEVHLFEFICSFVQKFICPKVHLAKII